MHGPLRLLALALVLSAGGCKSAREEARRFTRCSRREPCRKPNVCLRETHGGTQGVCVFPCRAAKDCPASFRCTGRYRLSERSGRFCRRPRIRAGGDCSRIQDGCQAGLRCFKNRCRKDCRSDKDCPDPVTRCLKIIDAPKTSGGTPARPFVCLKAVRKQGDSCRPHGPFCARDHLCHSGRCLRVCHADTDCGKAQICDGSLYTGTDAKARADRHEPPDVLYCRRAGRRDAFCNLRLDQTCARSLYCLGSRCRRIRRARVGGVCREVQGLFCQKGAICFAGRCRRTCSKSRPCPRRRGRRRTCEKRLVHGKKSELCL